MSEPTPVRASRRASQRLAAAARAEEETLRARWENRHAGLRERFDGPINRASELTQRTLAWFPIRVWRHFLQNNGFLLAAGISSQALFAFFAGIYVGFAAVGLWPGGSATAVRALVRVINSYVPGLIGDSGEGLIPYSEVERITSGTSGVLAVTGGIALLTAMWTAIGFVTFARRAVRDIFALPYDDRPYVLLKARDLLASIAFGTALVIGFLLTALGTWSLRAVLALFGFRDDNPLYGGTLQVVSVIVSLGINSAALAALFWFLTDTTRRWRTIWPGALVGGGAITVLQLGAGLLLAYSPTNPLLATFALFIGLLLWFRLMGIAMLVSASWIAVTAADEHVPLVPVTEAERLRREHEALLHSARERLRTAQDARAAAPWYRRRSADRAVAQARDELVEVAAASPPGPPRRTGFPLE